MQDTTVVQFSDTAVVQVIPQSAPVTVAGTTSVAVSGPVSVQPVGRDWSQVSALGSIFLGVALVVATVALVIATVRGQHRMNSLTESVAQQRLDHEKERDRLADERLRQERKKVDLRVSALAYVLERQISSWIDEPPVMTAEGDVFELVRTRKKEPEAVYTEVRSWAKHRVSSKHSDPASKRALALVLEGAHASEHVVDAVNGAFVEFHAAMGLMNQSLPETSPAKIVQLASNSYTKLKSCRDKLKACFHDLHRRQFVQMSAVAVGGSVNVKHRSELDDSPT